MQIDPTRWLVSFAGFVADWVISREWKRILLCMLPLFFLATVGGLVFWGSRLDKTRLAQRYMELGEKEIADWQKSWESAAKNEESPSEESPKSADDLASETVTDNSSGEAIAESKEPKQISRFAEVLFRRVQLLEPNNRSQFVIGVTLAQRGAAGQAQRMLNKIAPDDRAGYAPAHAWLAQSMLSQPITSELLPLFKHHVKQALTWDRVPEFVLLAANQMYWQLGERDEALRALERVAEIDPVRWLTLAMQAKMVENTRVYEHSIARAEAESRQKLAKNEFDVATRLHLATVLAEAGKLDETERLLRDGMKLAESPEYVRGISEVYRLRFLKSLTPEGGDLQMLDVALRTDPTNPLVVEEIAKLARLTRQTPSDELLEKLRSFVAEGKATAVTHAWISEIHLLNKDFKKALPHLEQVVNRLPTTAQYANNLAYILVELAPERIDEALQLAQRAVQLATAQGVARKFDVDHAADYADTLAIILAKQGKFSDAITALESAVERQPKRIDFHERLAEYYDKKGTVEMSNLHRKMAEELTKAEATARAIAAQQESEISDSTSDSTAVPVAEFPVTEVPVEATSTPEANPLGTANQ